MLLQRLAKRDARRGVAGFGLAKCTNEEAYLFQKMIRQGLRPQQRRSLHPSVPRVLCCGADGKRRLRCRHCDV